MKTNFLEVTPGNKSNSRRSAFIIILVALFDVQLILILAGGKNIILAATAAGTLFLTLAGSAMLFLFNQKKTEQEQIKNNEI